MPVKLFYNVFHELQFRWLVVIYFFLGGASCGTFLTSVASRLWGRERYQRIEKIGAVLTPILLGVGLLFLLLDLGRPERFYRLMINFNPTAVASWGVWLVNLLFLSSIVYAWFSLRQKRQGSKLWGLIGTPLAIAVSGYSGFILVQMKGYALWHSALLPLLFSVSALVSGIALVILGAILIRAEKEKIQNLGKFLAWFVSFDLLLVFIEIITLLNGGQDAMEAAKLLLVGSYSFSFLGLYVILGLIVPLLILIRRVHTIRSEAIASTLVLIGILAMRYAVILGGQYFPLS